MNSISIKDKKVFYNDHGKGEPLVLLHGFAESMEIWNNFAARLSREVRVITIDLPGHGLSDNLEPVHTMEIMADAVMAVLKSLKVKSCSMIGHSMGGYVTLTFVNKYPELIKRFGLFHSHPFADSKDQKINRDRASRIAELDKFDFIAGFIPELFPEDVREKWQDQINILVQKASAMSKEGVIAALQGMKERPDQTEVLKNSTVPVLIILGMKDSKFNLQRLDEMLFLPKELHCLILRNAGHMGYIEEEEATLRAVRGFVL